MNVQNNGRELNILHLFPDLLNLYGDKGNIACMENRLKWRGIGANVTSCTNKNSEISLKEADIVFLGGGSDREQEIVCNLLIEKRDELTEYVENGGVLVAVCGGYQLLGRYYQTVEKKIEGLGILDIYTEAAETRLIGDIVIEADFLKKKIVGFENHSGRTYIGDHKPLGKVLSGYGNNKDGVNEGVIYKNVFATYLHGPLFPKNPELCDYILSCAMRKKYPGFHELEALDDSLENMANEYMVNRILKSVE